MRGNSLRKALITFALVDPDHTGLITVCVNMCNDSLMGIRTLPQDDVITLDCRPVKL
jgi:hypothetical protein